jgi:hypothetical protein
MVSHHEISPQEVRIYTTVATANRWLTTAALIRATGLAPQTVRHHTRRLAELGVFERAARHPSQGFRLAATSTAQSTAYRQRLQQAQEMLAPPHAP